MSKKDFLLFRGKFRQHFTWTQIYQEVKRNSRISRGQYVCAHCRQVYSSKLVEVDHITPISQAPDIRAWDWGQDNAFIKAMHVLIDEFFSRENLQVLCRTCHAKKTHGIPV